MAIGQRGKNCWCGAQIPYGVRYCGRRCQAEHEAHDAAERAAAREEPPGPIGMLIGGLFGLMFRLLEAFFGTKVGSLLIMLFAGVMWSGGLFIAAAALMFYIGPEGKEFLTETIISWTLGFALLVFPIIGFRIAWSGHRGRFPA